MSHVADGPSPEGTGRGRGTSVDVDEPYTIKCICSFDDDDGNTVFCETCDTWQHIDCYYPLTTVPDVHQCVECEPRSVDGKRALERQRHRRRKREPGPPPLRRLKRPPAKVAKRKSNKDLGLVGVHVNGTASDSLPSTSTAAPAPSDRRNGVLVGGKDHPPPAKRLKSNHHPSNSVASQTEVKKLETPSSHASPANGVTSGNASPGIHANVNASANGNGNATAGLAVAVTPPDSTADAHSSPSHGQPVDDFRGDAPPRSKQEGSESPRRHRSRSSVGGVVASGAPGSWMPDPEALWLATAGRRPAVAVVFERVDAPFEALERPAGPIRRRRPVSHWRRMMTLHQRRRDFFQQDEERAHAPSSDLERAAVPSSSSPPSQSQASSMLPQARAPTVTMQDADADTDAPAPSPPSPPRIRAPEVDMTDAPEATAPPRPSMPPLHVPPPPVPVVPVVPAAPTPAPALTVTVPPTPTPIPTSTTGPDAVVVASPATLGPPATSFSPSVVSDVTQPRPIKKKMSLSDYTHRHAKAKAKAKAAGGTISTSTSPSTDPGSVMPTGAIGTHDTSKPCVTSPLRAEIKPPDTSKAS
ncbi:MAG: hypothetical protein M1823_000029 [Watsoniomyces obsoletus]|nr:MAG: hypothetical protein M1823_000029 [Watsoniomyces obsoletus]